MNNVNEVLVMFRNDNKAMLNVYKNFSSIKKHNEGIEFDKSTFSNDQMRAVTAEGIEVYFEIHKIID